MKHMHIKRLAAMLLCIIIILSSTQIAYAASIPSKYEPYVIDGRVDYRELYESYFKYLGGNTNLAPPTSSFTVSVNGEVKGYSDSGSILEVNVGDTLTIQNTSTKGSGAALYKCDFQVSDLTSIINNGGTTNLNEINLSCIDTSVEGKYNIYLNVMDNEDPVKTEGWGNWAYNGSHRAAGTNPGSGTGYDFPGWWYYSKLTIEVKNHPPTADFTINYKGSDVTDNSTSPVTVDPGDKSLVLQDCSIPYSVDEPITGRTWYYWDINSGWVEIAGSANMTTVNIADMDAGLPGSGLNKAFKLLCKSSIGGENYAEHTGYFEKVLSSGYIVYYRDVDTELDIYSPKVMEGLGFGTYTENALPAPANGELITPSPATITLDAATPFTAFTFYYKLIDPPPASNPPSAILDLPEEAMAGEVVKADGSDSWSNNPGGYIADWDFEYEGANLESDNNSNVKIWYPDTGTYEVYLEVEDENGKHDSMECEIEITPPIPTAVLNITGKLKENRKVTIDSSQSTSPAYYPIDTTKTVWTITPISGGTAADIKYLGTLNGNAIKDILFKKAGTYRIRLTVTNTYGLSASTEQTITIAPDLPPVAKIFLPTPAGVEYTIYRDPNDSNYATAEIFNESYSPDGDIIDKSAAFYCYDSDNDGDYTDEQWYYSKDGTTWKSTVMNFADTVSYFNIYNIATSNVPMFTHKSKEVGRYWYAIRVMETIPPEDTIPEFLIESDYKRADSFN